LGPPQDNDSPARVLFAVLQQAGICANEDELVWLMVGKRPTPKDRSLYERYLLPFDNMHRQTLPVLVAWRWCRVVAQTSTILRLSILLEPLCARLGVFRVDTGDRFMIRLHEPDWEAPGVRNRSKEWEGGK
jgi:hypothetical protein